MCAVQFPIHTKPFQIGILEDRVSHFTLEVPINVTSHVTLIGTSNVKWDTLKRYMYIIPNTYMYMYQGSHMKPKRYMYIMKQGCL